MAYWYMVARSVLTDVTTTRMVVTMLAAALMWAAVAAAENPDDAPLAIPAESPSPGARESSDAEKATRVPPLPPPATVTVRTPGDSGQRALAMRAYRDKYLSVTRVSELVTRSSVGWTFSTAPGFGVTGWVPFPQPWVYRVDRVGVRQAEEWLDVPSTLAALGDRKAANKLAGKIQRNRNATAFMQGVAVVGVGAMVAGLVGSDRASTYDELVTWQRVTGTGVGLTVGGLMLSALPGTRADRLQHDLRTTFEPEDLRRRVREHNSSLAEELGLDPETAVRLEGGPGSR